MLGAPSRRLSIRDFLHQVEDATLPQLDPALGRPNAKRVFSSLQIHFGEPRLHYEVWPVRKTGRIEIGLHIEGPAEWSRAVAAGLAAAADDLRAALGCAYELEDWTASWCRLHTTLPLGKLDPPAAQAVAQRTAALIGGAEPILRRIDLPHGPATSGAAPAATRRRWRGRRGGT